MATKVYDSPTSNIFALLADEHAGQSQPKKTNNKAAGANTGSLQESTPKERAEARAVQDAARKQQKEAEKAKKELDAARKKALELVDDTGFSQQRHQRIKDARQQALVEPASPSKSHKPRSKDGWDDTDAKGKGKPWPKADGAKGEGKGKAPAGNKTDLAGSPKTDGKAFNKPKGEGKAANFTKGDGKTFKDNKGEKTFNKGEVKGNFKGEGKVPFKNEGSVAKGAKSYDKHSQGVTSRQFQAKKQGHGKANWDENVPAGLSSAPVKDALASEALAAPAGGEVDGWGDSPAAPGAEADATNANQTDDKDNDAKDTKKEEDEDADKKTLDDYLLDQAEKKKALEAVVKALTPQTTVTEEEKKALSSKFTFFENPQAAPKPEAPKVAAVAPKAPAAAAPAPPAIATGFRVAGSRAGGRGGRFEGQQRDSPARQGGQRKGGRGPQKILKGKNEFPALSSTTK